MADATQKPKGTFAKLMNPQVSSPASKENAILPPQTTASKMVNQSIVQSTDQSIDQSTTQQNYSSNSSNAIVDRPKAFYITKRLDRNLENAVRYLQVVHGINKVDRSTVVNAFLDNDDNWTPHSLDQLIDRVIRQLTSRLTSRPTGK